MSYILQEWLETDFIKFCIEIFMVIIIYYIFNRSSAKKEIRDILETLKVKFKIYSSESQLNELSNPRGRRIFVFIFENLFDYYTMKKEGRALLDDYCKKNR